ncbi:MAG: hypothetical protein AABX30_00040 [Nanoarchaeota archaeon]
MENKYKTGYTPESADFYGKKDFDPNKESSGLIGVLDEPSHGEIIDEPVPELLDSCCCPCPSIISVGPFLAFGPLE